MPAVGVQVGAGPASSGWPASVGSASFRSCAAESASNGGSGLPSSPARRMNPASVRATSWLRPSGPGRFNCSGWNASAYSDQLLWHDMHWLRLWNCQTRFRFPSLTSFSAPSAGTRSASAWSSRQAKV